MGKYQHILRAILARPWAIDPESLAWAAICDVMAMRASGDYLSTEEISDRLSVAAAANGARTGGRTDRNVAIVPVYGVLSPRMDAMSAMSGGSSAESVRDAFRGALSNPDIDGIVFDVDSPGGVVEGIDELAAEIRDARGQKPIAAVANHLAASAAYWAMAGVDELVATPSATVGSIGIFTAHQDVSAAMEKVGVKTTLISAGKYKTEGNQYAPLDDEARADIQATVSSWYDTMVHSIAKGRGVGVDVVRDTYGEGRTFRAKRALERGMVDRIDSLDNTIRRVARGAVGRSRTAALTPGISVASLAAGESTDRDGAGAATSFAARAEAAAAEVVAIGELARKRAELRAEEGRAPSTADGLALATLAGSLAELPGVEVETTVETTTTTTTETVDDEVESETETPATEETAPRGRRLGLELLEAATAGGYALPS